MNAGAGDLGVPRDHAKHALTTRTHGWANPFASQARRNAAFASSKLSATPAIQQIASLPSRCHTGGTRRAALPIPEQSEILHSAGREHAAAVGRTTPSESVRNSCKSFF